MHDLIFQFSKLSCNEVEKPCGAYIPVTVNGMDLCEVNGKYKVQCNFLIIETFHGIKVLILKFYVFLLLSKPLQSFLLQCFWSDASLTKGVERNLLNRMDNS